MITTIKTFTVIWLTEDSLSLMLKLMCYELRTDLYELILKQIEEPLLSVVLEKTRGNQTKCAQILGLNRGTLRKKMKTYDLM